MEFEIIRLRNELSKLKREDAKQELVLEQLRTSYEEANSRLSAFQAQLAAAPVVKADVEKRRGSISGQNPRNQAQLVRKKLLLSQFRGVNNATQISEAARYVPPTQWEYVLVFLNPDHPDVPEDSLIKEPKAVELFQKCFRGEEAANYNLTLANYTIELQAFKQVFRDLESVEGGKKWSHGGRLKLDPETGFKDTLESPKDFLTLIRNVVMVKLTQHLGLSARQILSSDGKHIFIVISAGEGDLINEAIKTKFNAQLSISMIDLFSLDPCDMYLRPLRMASNKPPGVNPALETMKKAAKGLFSYKYLSADAEEGIKEYTVVGVTEEQWETYIKYLGEITTGILKLKTVDLPLKYRHLFLEKLFKKCKEKVNKQASEFGQILNLWDRLKIQKPIGPYTDYVQSVNPITGEDSLEALWQTFRIDEVGHRSHFRKMSRLKLLNTLLNSELLLHRLLKYSLLSDHFPLHDDWALSGTVRLSNIDDYDYLLVISKLNQVHKETFNDEKPSGLKQAWTGSFFNVNLPISKIRNYFGEKIGLFFAYESLLAKSTMIAAGVGLPVFLLQIFLDSATTALIAINCIFCYFLGIWSSVYLEMWLRLESTCAISWGMLDYELDEVPRPQFTGQLRRSAITDEMDEPYFDPGRRRCYIVIGILVSIILILMVLGIVGALIVVRWQLVNKMDVLGFDTAGPVVSIANAVQIQIFNIIYNRIALKLTDLENHITQSEYEDSFVLKSYFFQFMNSFNSLYYIAFMKTYMEGCIYTDSSGVKVKEIGANCMSELQSQLITLFLVAYLKDVFQIVFPYWNFKRQVSKLKREFLIQTKEDRWKLAGLHDTRVIRDEIEEQYILSPYNTQGVDGTFSDYMSLAIMFGYVTLFGLAFPLSSLLCFLLLLLDIRVNKLRMLDLTRRPQPMGARHIGIWWSLLQFTATIAIFTNAGLYCFTEPTFNSMVNTDTEKFIPFGIMVISLLVIRTWAKNVIPNVPGRFETLRKRHEYLVNRFVRVKTEGENKVEKDSSTPLNFKVQCHESISSETE